MKIVLVLLNEFIAENRNKRFSFIGKMGAYAPITLVALASLVPKELNAEIVIIDEFIESFDPRTIQADLVGLSFTTCNANHAYKLSEILRKRGVTVVFGGYHTTACPNEATKYSDACVLGYAEKAWPNLLRDFQSGKLNKIYNDDYVNEFLHLNVNKYNLLNKRKYFYPYTVEFSRSCKNSCNFCVIPQFAGKGVKYRFLPNVIKDIQHLKTKNIVFLDSSPAEDIKQFKELCYTLKKLNKNWFTSVTFKIAEDIELIKLMSDSGCKGIFIGFESINQIAVDREGKSFNNTKKYKEFIHLLHQHKIYVFGSFIFGFDSDDTNIFKRTVEFVNECNIDMVHYGILTPLPGSPLFKTLDKQERIISEDWSLYDSLHVTFKPKNMTPKELQDGFKWAYLKTHSVNSILKRTFFSPTRTWSNFFGNIALGIYGSKVLKNV